MDMDMDFGLGSLIKESKMSGRGMIAGGLLVMGIAVLSGCGQQPDSTSDTSAESGTTQTTVEVTVTPEMEAVLAKADALDGESDKTIKRCASCKLGMDGSSENALSVGQYTMHFCTGDCKAAFSKDVTASVLAMKPEEAKQH